MRSLVPIAALLLVAVALPAAAETYTIELTNGSTFVTRYRPQEASWDSELVLLLTESGNWIGLPRERVVSVVAKTEELGFGKIINTTTIDLGWAPNDNPLPEDQDPVQAQLDALQGLLQDEQSYSQQQFVSPGDLSGGGFPVNYGAGGGGPPRVFNIPGGGGGGIGGGGGAGAPSPPPPSSPSDQ